MKGYKTVIFGVLTFLAGLAGMTEVLSLIPLEWYPFALMVSGVAAVVLRYLTDTKIFAAEIVPEDVTANTE